MHFEEVVLQTASVARTKLFYGKTLELPISKETDDAITFSVGNSLLTFKAATAGKPYYHIAFNITPNKFSDSFEWLNRKLDIIPMQEDIPIAVYPEWNAQSFYFMDNNASILEFIARFDLPYISDAPFTIADIKEISEVGIATNDVGATAEVLHKDHGVPLFRKTKTTEHFTALGDDHGLFILSHTSRTWVPTDKPSRPFPITVVADGKTITF
jgi:catechol-2,3-dioxygenase